jgi:hypothetical protein
MKMLPYLTSIATLISVFVLGPALGRAIFPQGGQLARSVGKMIAIVGLLFLYGIIWTANPSLVSWYTWLAEVPINGSINIPP